MTVPSTILTLATSLAASVVLSACPDSNTSTPDAPVDARPADFELTLSTERLPVLQNTTATIGITIKRQPGFTGAITLTPVGLPPGATAPSLALSSEETTADLVVSAAETAPHSLPTPVTIRATSGEMAVEARVDVTVYGPPGSLDTSFAGGRVLVPVGASDDYAYAAAVQPDGKLLLAGRSSGDFSLIRLDRDGALDAAFGTGGKVITNIADGTDTAYAIAVQPDGKIVVAGTATVMGNGLDFALVRYDQAGALDQTFGTGGKVTTSLGNDSDVAYALLLQPDGKIVVAGDSYQGAATGVDFALARYTATGALDKTFDGDGKVTTALAASTGRDSAYALALQQVDGELRIVAAGGEGDFAVARYRANGALDTTFGKTGSTLGVWGSVIGAARAVAVTADQKLVVAGHRAHDFAVVRLTAAGQLDTMFGTDGRTIAALSASNWDEAQGLVIEPDGKLVLAGWTYEGGGSSGNFSVVRFTAGGVLDPSFGGGAVITHVAEGSRNDQGTAVLLQSDPRVPGVRVVVAGYASTSNSEFAVTRYWR